MNADKKECSGCHRADTLVAFATALLDPEGRDYKEVSRRDERNIIEGSSLVMRSNKGLRARISGILKEIYSYLVRAYGQTITKP